MPGLHALSSIRALEGLVLQPPFAHTQQPASIQQQRPVGGNQMRHRLAAQREPMQPQASIEGMSHSLSTMLKLTPMDSQLQDMEPSLTAVPTGAALPTNM